MRLHPPRVLLVVAGTMAIAVGADAHVGSPNVFFEGTAGPYPVRVVIRPPGVVPGLAEIAVRARAPAEGVAIRLFRWNVGEEGAPPAEPAARVPGDDELFSAELWLMTSGAHSVEISVTGPQGDGRALVPFESVRREALGMETGYGAVLLGMGLFLFVGAVTILGASVRESTLVPGADPEPTRRRRGRIAATIGTLLATGLLWGGWNWWSDVDAAYRASIFEPMATEASVDTNGEAPVLELAITEQRWLDGGWSPLVPDHGKLMHMFLVRDDHGAFAHVHPVRTDEATFRLRLPPLPQGRYRIYGDIVHESGFAQTLVNEVTLPDPARRSGDPADGATGADPERAGAGDGAPENGAPAADPDDSWTTARRDADAITFDDGTVVAWERPADPIEAGAELTLSFVARAPDGEPAALDPYMGMLAHAAIARTDGEVFVHLHPGGSISMGSLRVAAERRELETMPMHADATGRVAFPYAFPSAGDYRVWVQLKRAGRVFTADFGLTVR